MQKSRFILNLTLHLFSKIVLLIDQFKILTHKKQANQMRSFKLFWRVELENRNSDEFSVKNARKASYSARSFAKFRDINRMTFDLEIFKE